MVSGEEIVQAIRERHEGQKSTLDPDILSDFEGSIARLSREVEHEPSRTTKWDHPYEPISLFPITLPLADDSDSIRYALASVSDTWKDCGRLLVMGRHIVEGEFEQRIANNLAEKFGEYCPRLGDTKIPLVGSDFGQFDLYAKGERLNIGHSFVAFCDSKELPIRTGLDAVLDLQRLHSVALDHVAGTAVNHAMMAYQMRPTK